ncbi:esterase/lipase family protein [Variovorax sp. VNK109]|uniref:esterase/lipase family protein n=1 Tax=Variovorax sp. VNK109 TaxID=3400919 RepID=UPI003C07D5FB
MTELEEAPFPYERRLYANLDVDGSAAFVPTLTHASRTDCVALVLREVNCLPIVFVPGIMGSNLRIKAGEKGAGNQAWRLDSKGGLAKGQALKEAGERQSILHPARTEVDPGGDVPSDPVGLLRNEKEFRMRGWGEVAAASYQALLIWLEQNFNSQQSEGVDDPTHNRLKQLLRQIRGTSWDAQKPFEPITEQEEAAAVRWSYPVYACGYNWLDSNEEAAKRLAARIGEIIGGCQSKWGRCEQVILLTHSMGGLVARRCAALAGMAGKIAGVVHGVMPAIGAAVAYRRCKVGMMDETPSNLIGWGAAKTIGATGREVTAVFAQAPGALQLLPTQQYRRGWFEIRDSDGQLMPGLPETDNPYDTIYAERNRWWGLIKEEWLAPKDGVPIKWIDYESARTKARDFHLKIKDAYHATTYGFYGTALPSFEKVCWRLGLGVTKEVGVTQPPPDASAVLNRHRSDVVLDGTNPEHLPGPRLSRQVGMRPVETQSFYELRLMTAADTGDGTVPESSGRAPLPHVKQLFAVRNIEHESAYQNAQVQQITAYAIARIAAQTRLPAGKPASGHTRSA